MVIVVGAGPCGLIASYHLCRLGAEAVVVEQNSEVGLDPHCGGVVSSDFWEKLKVPPHGEVILNSLYGLNVYFGAHTIRFTSKRPYALVLDRTSLERHLYDVATKEGASVIFRKRAEGLTRVGENADVKFRDGSVMRDRHVLLADGVARSLARQIGLGTRLRANPAFQVLVKGSCLDCRASHVFIGNDTHSNIFSYYIPVDEHTGRLGVITSGGDPANACEKIMKDHNLERIHNYRRWAVWLHGPLEHPGLGNVLLVGDAGGFTKPISGGGIAWGGLSARTAAEAIAKSETFEESCRRYSSAVHRIFTRESEAQKLARGILSSGVSVHPLRFLAKVASVKFDVLDTIDYDFPFTKPPRLALALQKTRLGD